MSFNGGGGLMEDDGGGASVSATLAGVLNTSIVPTMLVNGQSGLVTFANKAALNMFPSDRRAEDTVSLLDLSHPDDAGGLADALAACVRDTDRRRFVRHRFVGPDGAQVPAEIALTGCDESAGFRGEVLVQLRSLSADSTVNVFIRLLSDNPDGEIVATAIRTGPLARLPVDMVTVSSVHPKLGLIKIEGAMGLSDRSLRDYRFTPLNHLHPVGLCAMSGELQSMTMKSMAAQFPLVSAETRSNQWFESGDAVFLPITCRGRTLGVLMITFQQQIERTWALLEQLSALAQSLSLWLLLREPDSPRMNVPQSSPMILRTREIDVLRFVEGGLTNGRIAEETGYSEATIRADLLRLSKMLGVRGRREVVRRARELGLYEG
ncbi:MAG: Bacterial regulatory protein luxR family [Actinomycetota bacterium]